MILAAIQSGNIGLILDIGIVLMSDVSAYYYLRLVATLYFSEPAQTPRQTSTPLLHVGIAGLAGATILGGFVFAAPIYDLADRWSSALEILAHFPGRFF
ncbi:MAG: hypothetical protein ACKOCK_10815 [Chloroflexota bacterium]